MWSMEIYAYYSWDDFHECYSIISMILNLYAFLTVNVVSIIRQRYGGSPWLGAIINKTQCLEDHKCYQWKGKNFHNIENSGSAWYNNISMPRILLLHGQVLNQPKLFWEQPHAVLACNCQILFLTSKERGTRLSDPSMEWGYSSPGMFVLIYGNVQHFS